MSTRIVRDEEHVEELEHLDVETRFLADLPAECFRRALVALLIARRQGPITPEGLDGPPYEKHPTLLIDDHARCRGGRTFEEHEAAPRT